MKLKITCEIKVQAEDHFKDNYNVATKKKNILQKHNKIC